MARKTTQKPLDMAAPVPWPAAVVLGLAGYLLIRYGLRWLPGGADPSLGDSIRQVAAGQGYAQLSWGVLAACWLIALGSFLHRSRKRAIAKAQDRAGELSRMPSSAFDRIVQEAFRRQGFVVTENRRTASSVRVDLVLRKDGRTTLVHCLQTADGDVGESLVQDLLDQRKRHGAAAVYIVTMGGHTPAARRLARGRPIELIAGTRLLEFADPLAREDAEPASFIDSPLALLGSMAGAVLMIATMQHSARHGSGLSPIPDNLVALLPYEPVPIHTAVSSAPDTQAAGDAGAPERGHESHAARAMAIIDPTATDDP